MKRLLLIALSITTISLFSGCSKTESIDLQSLPKHTIEKSALTGNSNRIQINVVDSFLIKSDCESLINAYRPQAGTDGQVVIYGISLKMKKLFPDDPESNKPCPWAVDNMDGAGIQYNDFNYGNE